MNSKLWIKAAAKVFGVVAGSAWLWGCSDEPTVMPPCAATDEICGVCAGVPSGDVCAGDTCADGVTCSEVVVVASAGELASKIGAATAGTCLALAPGQYGAVSVPGGVSLLGRSAAAVKLDGIIVTAGDGTVLRGLGVGSGGVALMGATGVRIESVRVTGNPSLLFDGISLTAGSSATIVTSTIDSAGRAGVYAIDADVTLDRCIVSGAQATGVWVEGSTCDDMCACPGSPTLTMSNSALRNNYVLGLSIRGAVASLMCTDVASTQPGDKLMTGKNGGGVTATQCSSVNATKLRVLDSEDWGMLIDGSAAILGVEGSPDDTVEISRNRRGLWVQNVVDKVSCQNSEGCVELHNGTLAENVGVGIGVSGSPRGMIICKSSVLGTLETMLPVSDVNGMVGASKAVGDGVDWLDGSKVVIAGLTLSGNQRQSLLIDGPATGSIMSINLEGGDANKGLLQQNLMMGGAQPMQGVGVSLKSQEPRAFAVPVPLTAPASL